MAKPKTKLPRVWVEFMESGLPRAVYSQKVFTFRTFPYVPAQPPKKCVVKAVTFDGRNSTKCGLFPQGFDFCPYCGGKITRRSAR